MSRSQADPLYIVKPSNAYIFVKPVYIVNPQKAYKLQNSQKHFNQITMLSPNINILISQNA